MGLISRGDRARGLRTSACCPRPRGRKPWISVSENKDAVAFLSQGRTSLRLFFFFFGVGVLWVLIGVRL